MAEFEPSNRRPTGAASGTWSAPRRHCLGTLALGLLGVWATPGAAQDGSGPVVVVAHPSWGDAVDLSLLGRLFTGRVVEIGGTAVFPCQLAPGHPARDRFLSATLRQTEAEFRAYWTVRRHVGKGTPPREFANAQSLLAHVAQTPGAIGYVPSGETNTGVRALLRL